MADRHFADQRLADIYDPLDPDRSDLDVYDALVDELRAVSVLDIGCGTGTLSCRLALRGIHVTGVDPAAASIEVAKRKLGADRVRWVIGDTTALPALEVDLALMTGNVAQVFVGDADWLAVLRRTRDAVADEGRLVFETRIPERQAWLEWTRERSVRRTQIDGVGVVETWVEVTDVRGSLVTFESSFLFEDSGELMTSESTLRFRSMPELEASLEETGFGVDEVRGAPDRPGREWVVIAHRSQTGN